MMDYTDRHCRFFLRLLSRHTVLFTEMVNINAILHNDRDRALSFHPSEHPVVLQLGGSDPGGLAECARMAADYGYDAVNLNCGCPSDRVRDGRFGACLIREPALVGRCVDAMRNASNLPVHVKTRIGLDHDVSYDKLKTFVAEVGCPTFIIHARAAWLSGLSPKQNREIPPLNYPMVHRLKEEFPHLEIIINGGLKTFDDITAQLLKVDGVMLGRQVVQNPYMLAQVDQNLFGSCSAPPSRLEIISAMADYAESELVKGTPLARITRHLLPLFQGCPGARQWRRLLSEQAHRPLADFGFVQRAAQLLVQGYAEENAPVS